jgi:hypothetical protein
VASAGAAATTSIRRGSHGRAGAKAARERKEILELQPHRIEPPVNFRITLGAEVVRVAARFANDTTAQRAPARARSAERVAAVG